MVEGVGAVRATADRCLDTKCLARDDKHLNRCGLAIKTRVHYLAVAFRAAQNSSKTVALGRRRCLSVPAFAGSDLDRPGVSFGPPTRVKLVGDIG